MKRLILHLFLLVVSMDFLCANIYAAGNSDIITPEMISEVNEYVNQNNPSEAAVNISAVNADQTLFETSYGYCNKEKQITADSGTVYEWGSLTKVLTWISVMQLYEQGKIDLNEDINNYLPEHYLKKLTYDRPVTMLDLMNHTGGWQDSITNVYTGHTSDILPLKEYVTRYEPIQLYEPGTTVAYSNWGTTLAGYIVEYVSGESYCDYVNTHILKPLDMKHTSIDPLRRDNEFVRNAIRNNTGYSTDGKEIKGIYYAPDYPAAGAAGTAGDIQHLMQALLGSQERKVFKNPDTLEKMMQTSHFYGENQKNTPDDSLLPENAHGLWYDFYTIPTLGHYGNTVQFSTHMILSPEKNLGLLVMTNQAQEMKLNHGVGDIVFGEGTHLQTGTDQVDNKWPEYQFQKHYTSTRTIEKGFCRFYHYFCIYRVKETGENTILLSSPGMKIPCKRIGEKIYRAQSGFAEGYYFSLDVDSKGVVQQLSGYTFDMHPCSSIMVFIDTVSFLLAFTALLMAVTGFVICMIRIISKKKGFVYPFVMNALTLLYFVLVGMEAMKLSSTGAATGDIIPYVIAYIFYILSGGIYIIWFFYDKIKCKIKEKTVVNIRLITLLPTIVVIGFILYWQMIFI